MLHGREIASARRADRHRPRPHRPGGRRPATSHGNRGRASPCHSRGGAQARPPRRSRVRLFHRQQAHRRRKAPKQRAPAKNPAPTDEARRRRDHGSGRHCRLASASQPRRAAASLPSLRNTRATRPAIAAPASGPAAYIQSVEKSSMATAEAMARAGFIAAPV